MLGIVHGARQTNLVPLTPEKSSLTSPWCSEPWRPYLAPLPDGSMNRISWLAPVQHRRRRVELVVELCGQRPELGGALVGDDGWRHGGRVGDGQLDQPGLIGLEHAGAHIGVLRAAIADARPAVLRGRQRDLVCAGPGQRLLVGGLHAAVEVSHLRVVADQLLRPICGFGAVDPRRRRRCSGSGRWMGCFRAAGARTRAVTMTASSLIRADYRLH